MSTDSQKNPRSLARGEVNKHQRYEAEKQTWLWLHKNATPQEIEAALKKIARRLGV